MHLAMNYQQVKKLSPQDKYRLILEEATIDFNKVMHNWRAVKFTINSTETKSLLRTYLSKYFRKYYSYNDYDVLSYRNPLPMLNEKTGLLSGIEVQLKYAYGPNSKLSVFQEVLNDFDFDNIRFNPEYMEKDIMNYQFDKTAEYPNQSEVLFGGYEKRRLENLVDYSKINNIKF